MNSSANVTYSFEEDWDEFVKKGIPITVFLVVVCVVGTVGNVHVFLVYLLRYKSNIYKTFILCLAAVDFLGCTFCIPASLYIIRHPNTLQSSAFCKMSSAVTYFVGAYSLLLLDCIAVERYRKVCQATRAQFTLQMTRIVCAVGCLSVIVVIAIPVIVIYGINQKITEEDSLIGYECTVLEYYKSSTMEKNYRLFVLFAFVVLFIISIVLYILIGRRIYDHKNKHRKTDTLSRITRRIPEVKLSGSESELPEDGGNKFRQEAVSVHFVNSASAAHITSDSDLHTERHVMTSYPPDTDMKSDNSGGKKQHGSGKRYRKASNKRKEKTLNKSRKITMIFLVVSVVSFGVYIPLLLVSLIRNINRSLYENFADNYGALDVFIRYMVFLNNAINPLVYGFMDETFRKELSKWYLKLFRYCSVLRK